jgi:hypothetical protein
MDNEPEVIREQMAETRASLTEKLETLEQQVVGTVQGATSAVTETVENVKEAVHETVDTVKETFHDTVDGVRESLDLCKQVDRHPYLMMAAACSVGYISGRLLFPSSHLALPLPSDGSAWTESPRPEARNWRPEERFVRDHRRETPRRSLTMDRLTDKFRPELDQLKGMAIGYLAGAVRDLLRQSLPDEMAPKFSEVMNSITTKLGGQPIEGPVLKGTCGDIHSTGDLTAEERTGSGPRTDARARW